MALGNKKMKERVAKLLQEMIDGNASDEYKALAQEWIANKEDAEKTKEIAPKLRKCIAESAAKGCPVCKELQTLDHYLVKRSQWIIGGDGASYDIGYGGLDHVIASGEDVNILVLDTEVYSNTGGQASKATPLGAIAQLDKSLTLGHPKASFHGSRLLAIFAAQGKRIRKKDLGMIATIYGYVYVAQIAMGADHAQTLKAIREAVAWHGPSIIIAYAPCINHGLKAKGGMGKSQAEEKGGAARLTSVSWRVPSC